MLTTSQHASTATTVIPLHPARARRLAEAQIVPLAEAVSAIIFDLPHPIAVRHRLRAEVDGQPVGGRVVSTSLPLRTGGTRHLLQVGVASGTLARSGVTVSLGGEPAAALDPEWLQSPVAGIDALIDGLSEEGRRRLLRLFLTTGSSLFGLDRASELGAALDRLLDLIGLRARPAASSVPVGRVGRIFSFRVEHSLDAARIGTLVALSPRSITRLAGSELRTEQLGRAALLHVFVPSRTREASALIGLGASPVLLGLPQPPHARPRPLTPWLARRSRPVQAWACGLLEAGAADDPIAAAQLREVRHAEDPAPRAAARFLAGTPAGILHALSLDDPHDLLEAVRIERGGSLLDLPVLPSAWPSRSLSGFARLPRASAGADRFRLRVIYRSGRVRTVAEGSLRDYRGEVPEALGGQPAAVAEARLSLPERRCRAEAETFGTPPDEPALSLVAAVGENLDVVRTRAAMLFAEPGAGSVELVCHAPAGPLAVAARRMVADTAAAYGIAHRLVTIEPGADASERLLAAIGEARGASLLLLGPDVLPAGPGWLAPWLCRLVPMRPVLGGTLIDAAGAVIDAGGAPEGGDCRFAGLPMAELPGTPSMATRRATAECVGLTRAAAELLGDASRYPNPDVMLAETIARLIADGKEAATLLRSRFVRYAVPVHDRATECVDSEALRLVLKRSFSDGGEKDRP